MGSIVELPKLSVMVMGLDDWHVEQSSEIREERLLAAARDRLGDQLQRLLSPPLSPDGPNHLGNPFDDNAHVGVPVAPFPRWVVCPYCRLLARLDSGLFELKTDAFRQDRNRYVHRNCTKPGRPPTVVPARFLVACNQGHLDDFPWVEFVHGGYGHPDYRLRLYELGASGEVADIQVECEECGKKRRMSEAFSEKGRAELAQCRGRWPHLRKPGDGGCLAEMKPILLGASNSWFPVQLSALSIPQPEDRLAEAVRHNWTELADCETPRDVKLLRRHLHGLTGPSDEEICECLLRLRNSTAGEPEKTVGHLREPEWRVLSDPGSAVPSRDFKLRQVRVPSPYASLLDRIVLAERLREVSALIGFTRIESPGDFGDIEEMPDDRCAPLSRSDPRWVPAAEVRGEGIFIQFNETRVQEWVDSVSRLDEEFMVAHRRWRAMRKLDPETAYPGTRYVLLHSFAHAVMRQLALECGYSAASIKERIYCESPRTEQSPMAGVLLYTAAPDSEGTLGGLVALGESNVFGHHLDRALDAMGLCASDPLCAEHRAASTHLALHGAACHACLFAAETSCERGNKYLDRSVLVDTVDRSGLSFFSRT